MLVVLSYLVIGACLVVLARKRGHFKEVKERDRYDGEMLALGSALLIFLVWPYYYTFKFSTRLVKNFVKWLLK